MVKAVRIDAHGGPEVLKLVDIDVPAPGAGEVRLRQHVLGLNFIDIYFRTGLYQSPLPHGLGFEGAGVVEAVGAGVTNVQVGDRVAYAQSPIGAYAEVRNVPAGQLVKLPDDIGFDVAAAVMLKGLTVQYLFRQTFPLQGGETILFHAAAGGVGLIACQWARALGVKLIGTVSSAEKAALARQYGAWETINSKTEDVRARVLELTGGAKVPVVYDSVGKDTWEISLDCLKPRGLMVSFGNASGAVDNVNIGILAQKGSLFVTRPTLGHHVATPATLQAAADELFDHIRAGRITPIISRRYRLEDVAQAHTDLASRTTTGSSIFELF